MSDICTIPVNLAGLPAISIPCGLSRRAAGGLPAHRPGVLREPHPRGRARPRGRHRLRHGALVARLSPPTPVAGRGVVMSAWEPVIGLEVHVELDTQTKMFCGCAVTKGDPPNTHTCPVCLAHPGALPVVNQRAVEYATRIALALRLHGAAAQRLPPQELLLSRPAQGVPDQPVRRAARRRAAGSSTGSATRDSVAASTACIWRRTPPSWSTPAARRGASPAPSTPWSTSTAAARR